MPIQFDRRQVLLAGGAAVAATLSSSVETRASSVKTQVAPTAASNRPANEPFGYCLNMSTIRGQKLSLSEQVEVAAKAGYQAIEPWIREIQEFADKGGKLTDVKKQIADAGMTVESAIGFANWIVDDDEKRAKGLETARRDMDLVRQIGGKRIAAPPAGATRQGDLNLFRVAERYRALLELGKEMGVTPQVELWGFSQSMKRLGELVFVATESGHPDACMLPDVYHIYKGGSDFEGLRMINGAAIQVFHMNDYPNDPPRDTIGDAHRVYPGDGVAPLSKILRDVHSGGFRGMLSLELFNRDYWKQDPLDVARTGLEKMRSAVKKAFA
jgi:sugar phosphate isomerase/epimerase